MEADSACVIVVAYAVDKVASTRPVHRSPALKKYGDMLVAILAQVVLGGI